MTKKLIEITSEIVQQQVAITPMSAADITASLQQVFSTLMELQRAESTDTELPGTPGPALEGAAGSKALAPKASIQENKVVCLECGAEMKQLTSKHLVSHGMNQKDYRKKYGFTMRTALAAKSLTRSRSKAAKKRGLPENLLKAIEAKRQSKAGAAAVTRSPRKKK
jgi:predicted transcriptional regulator